MIRNWLGRTRRAARSERGQNMVEYGLILLVVALGLIAALGPYRDKVSDVFGTYGECLGAVKSGANSANC